MSYLFNPESTDYLTILEDQTELITRFRPDGTLVFVNDAFCRYYGVTKEAVIGRSYKPRIYPEDQVLIDQCLAALSPERPVGIVEHRVVLDGQIRWMEWVNRSIYNDQGQLVELQSVGRDIDERKCLELELVSSRDFLKHLFHESSDTLFLVDAEARLIIDCNQQALNLFDVQSKAELLCIEYATLQKQPSTPAEQALIDQTIAEKGSWEMEVEYVSQRGRLFWGAVSIKRILFERQKLNLVRVIDVTEQKQTETALQKLNQDLTQRVCQRTKALQIQADRERMLRTVIQKIHSSLNFDDVLSTLLSEMRQILQGDRALIYQFQPGGNAICVGALARADFSDLYPSELSEDWLLLFTTDKSNIGIWHQDLLVVNDVDTLDFSQDKAAFLERIPARAYIFSPIVLNGSLWGLLAIYHYTPRTWQGWEMSLLQQLSLQVAIALRQSNLYQVAQAQVKGLEHLNRLKDDFLSTVSHELRTPITNIKMAITLVELQLQQAGLLLEENSPLSHYFTILKEEIQREFRLINDLLEFSRFQSATDLQVLSVVSLQRVIPQLVDPFVERARLQHQTLTLHLADDLPPLITYAPYLERILQELLENAFKYTPAGEKILVSVDLQAEMVFLEVANSGVEIPEGEQERIFERFYRITGKDPWKHGGTGLGLALVKELVLQMGGRISVVSQHNWTKFQITLPLRGND